MIHVSQLFITESFIDSASEFGDSLLKKGSDAWEASKPYLKSAADKATEIGKTIGSKIGPKGDTDETGTDVDATSTDHNSLRKMIDNAKTDTANRFNNFKEELSKPWYKSGDESSPDMIARQLKTRQEQAPDMIDRHPIAPFNKGSANITRDEKNLIGGYNDNSMKQKVRNFATNAVNNTSKWINDNPAKTAAGVGAAGLATGAGAMALAKRKQAVKK